MMDRFSEAAARDPQHAVLIRNVERARGWFNEQGPERGLPLELQARQGFELLERTVQPTLPGPLPEDVLQWSPSHPATSKTGNGDKTLDARKRLELAPDD